MKLNQDFLRMICVLGGARAHRERNGAGAAGAATIRRRSARAESEARRADELEALRLLHSGPLEAPAS
jgi:hypothetical protein